MLMQQIADYAIRDQTAKLSDEVIHHAKRAVIDWYAALLPGSIVAPATLLEQAFAEDLDRGRARLASGRRATLRAAALINGAASHSVEFDDIYGRRLPPGCPTMRPASGSTVGPERAAKNSARDVGMKCRRESGEAVMFATGSGTDRHGGALEPRRAATISVHREQFATAATVGTFDSGLQQATPRRGPSRSRRA